eukprot:9100673-Alexandrium_andersonii.AAC.1
MPRPETPPPWARRRPSRRRVAPRLGPRRGCPSRGACAGQPMEAEARLVGVAGGLSKARATAGTPPERIQTGLR